MATFEEIEGMEFNGSHEALTAREALVRAYNALGDDTDAKVVLMMILQQRGCNEVRGGYMTDLMDMIVHG